MELEAKLNGKQVYFDTNIIIYLIEGFSSHQKLIDIIQELLENNKITSFTSELTLCESLIKPLKLCATEAASIFRTFLEESGCFRLLPIDKDILLQSAYISATTGIKTPDAIHVASAIAGDCEIFLTNDQNIKTPRGIEKVLLSGYKVD